MTTRRRGSLVAEAALAIVLGGLTVAAVGQLLIAAGRQQAAVEARRLASLEVANNMEQLMQRPISALTEERLAELKPSAEVQRLLLDARLVVSATPLADEPDERTIQVELHWRTRGGQVEQTTLTARRLSPPEEQP